MPTQPPLDYKYLCYRDVNDLQPHAKVNPHDLHYHIELLFSYIIKGKICIKFQSKTETLSEGDGIFINALTPHSCAEIEASPLRVFNLFIYPCSMSFPVSQYFPWGKRNMGNLMLSYLIFRKGSGGVKGKILKQISDMAMIGGEGLTTESEQALVASLMKDLRLLTPFRRTYGYRCRRIRFVRFVKLRGLIIQDSESGHFDLKRQLCACGESVKTGNSLFKEFLGYTLTGFVRDIRVDFALRQLKAGVPIAKIAASLNYSSTGNFTRAFFRIFNETPTDFSKH